MSPLAARCVRSGGGEGANPTLACLDADRSLQTQPVALPGKFVCLADFFA